MISASIVLIILSVPVPVYFIKFSRIIKIAKLGIFFICTAFGIFGFSLVPANLHALLLNYLLGWYKDYHWDDFEFFLVVFAGLPSVISFSFGTLLIVYGLLNRYLHKKS